MHIVEKELSCPALVLKSQPYRDKDIIYNILTEHSGKLGVIAKGAKGGKKFLGGIPEVLDLGTFDLKKGRGSLLIVAHFKPKQAFANIRNNLHSYIAACCWIESIDHLTSEAHQDSHELFEISISVLDQLNAAIDTRSSFRCLCEGLEAALAKTGFGSENSELQTGLKKMHILARRIEEISGRPLQSWESVLEIARKISVPK
jgi:DNA repair protein RecO